MSYMQDLHYIGLSDPESVTDSYDYIEMKFKWHQISALTNRYDNRKADAQEQLTVAKIITMIKPYGLIEMIEKIQYADMKLYEMA